LFKLALFGSLLTTPQTANSFNESQIDDRDDPRAAIACFRNEPVAGQAVVDAERVGMVKRTVFEDIGSLIQVVRL
jgi:hypothetical protein